MRRLHFGCGPNRLPEPWENFDRDVDITQPLPFPTESARVIFAEHVLEHVPFLEGMCFLYECRRVLEPGGVLRFSFPDVTRFADSSSVATYAEFLRSQLCIGIAEGRERSSVFRFILLGSRHRSGWTRELGEAAAIAVNFARVDSSRYGESFYPVLRGIDGHHKTSSVAILETTVLEAKK